MYKYTLGLPQAYSTILRSDSVDTAAYTRFLNILIDTFDVPT